jgi:hypothetical protein
LAFSTALARRAYLALRRWFEGGMALFFAGSGIRMLLSRI